MNSFTYSEDKISYYIFRKPEGKTWDECFMIIPLINDPDKCLVYYFSSFKSGVFSIDEKPVSPFVESFLTDERMMFIRDLRNYVNKQPIDLEMNRQSGSQTPLKKTNNNKIVQGFLITEPDRDGGKSTKGFKYPPSESSVVL